GHVAGLYPFEDLHVVAEASDGLSGKEHGVGIAAAAADLSLGCLGLGHAKVHVHVAITDAVERGDLLARDAHLQELSIALQLGEGLGEARGGVGGLVPLVDVGMVGPSARVRQRHLEALAELHERWRRRAGWGASLKDTVALPGEFGVL